MRRFKAIFFDLYNTVLFEKGWDRFVQHLTESFQESPAEVLKAYKTTGQLSMSGQVHGMQGRVESLLKQNFHFSRDIEPSALAAELQEVYFQCLELYSDTVRVLEYLSRNHLLFAVSNASEYTLGYLERLNIKHFFSEVVLSCDVACMKPDPTIYQVAQQRARCRPEDICFVGDGGDEELRGARQAGFFTVLLDRKLPHTAHARPHADRVVEHLGQLMTLLAHPEEHLA